MDLIQGVLDWLKEHPGFVRMALLGGAAVILVTYWESKKDSPNKKD